MSDLPEGLQSFVTGAGWGDAAIEPIPGDASFRRYFRLRRDNGDTAMLMHAPPPEEDPQPFLHVAHWLSDNGMRAPAIFAEDAAQGWVLTEDFGNDRMREWVDAAPQSETAAYETAIDALVALHQKPAGPFAPYDMATYRREAALLTEWYAPAQSLEVDEAGYAAAWEQALAPMIERQGPGVTVLRDYHAENIMLLGDPLAGAPQGLIDFQDALVGHRAYDLVSLLQDARRDVSEELEAAMLARYAQKAGSDDEFLADYARLGAQRNAKIVGIFTRLYMRDGKPRYLSMIPRVWAAMERDLAHPALAPVAEWFAANIPDELRKSGGGTIA
ncbi:phosphotransferase [uncultured Erythrobacter sp.]|uniref:aminoglycoside phosphotransferase family protein n=1 Tax=uncultured Erythrobacter sp. TaxID=263913 RepID=UPI0026253786|nr:phosphotransferase [uncultured Erythrobacter sp.]